MAANVTTVVGALQPEDKNHVLKVNNKRKFYIFIWAEMGKTREKKEERKKVILMSMNDLIA